MRANLLLVSVLSAALALPPQPLGSAVLERKDRPDRAVRVDHDGLFRYEPGPAVFPEGEMYVLCLPDGGCVRGERLRRKIRPAVVEVPVAAAPARKPAPGEAPAPQAPAAQGPQEAPAGAAAPGPVQGPAGRQPAAAQPAARTGEAVAVSAGTACRAAVYFDKNRWEMGRAQRAQADRFVRCISDCSRTEVAVAGYTCDLGPAKWNRELAGRRAAAVAGYLEKKGLKIAGIEARPQSGYLSPDRRFNRRVEVETASR